MSSITDRYGGKVIKTIGDEVMSTFPSADAATEAAAEMQMEITEEMVVDGTDVSIRVGFHFGPALFEKGDVFGDAVNTAARMAGQAKSGQILTTSGTRDYMSEAWQAQTRQIDTAKVKGKAAEIEMIEVLWQQESGDVTKMAGADWTVVAPQWVSMSRTSSSRVRNSGPGPSPASWVSKKKTPAAAMIARSRSSACLRP